MHTTDSITRLEALIHDVPDFPKPGVVYKDFTPMLADPGSLALAVELMANPYRGKGIDLIVGAESRGFIFGTAIAQALSAGFVPVRKPGKLPREVHAVEYDLEYGTDRLEIHRDALPKGAKVLLVDDLLATGGTMRASCQLVKKADVEIAGITVLIELGFLNGADKISEYAPVHSVIQY
ncbi:MAG: adenine phosphoribosyltransferase [Phycisphaerales bacterium]|nr:adenine phosphoribosyltransferase [Phycisphaerales bacterium]